MADRLITPGAIDLHTHLREPSNNHAETIDGGTRAALLGGFVLLCDMPNNPGQEVWFMQDGETVDRYSFIVNRQLLRRG